MRQQAWAWSPFLNGTRWQRCLADLFTARACHTRANNPVHDEPARNVFQFLGDILAERLQRPATGITCFAGGENLIVAVQMFGQRLTAWLALLAVGLIGLIVITRRCCRGPGDLFLFQCQFKLIKGFGAGAKPVTPQPGQLMLELLNPVITLLDLCREDRQLPVSGLNLGIPKGDDCLQFGDVTGQIGGRVEHEDL